LDRGKWDWIRTIVGGDLCRGVPVNHREGRVSNRESDKRGEEGRGRRQRYSWGESEERIRKKWGVYMGKNIGDVHVGEVGN